MRISMKDSLAARRNDDAIKGKASVIANNTFRFITESGAVVIRLHKTDIFREYAGELTLNSGGWKTVTTKDRLNEALSHYGYSIYSGKGQWFVTKRGEEKKVPFFDGMVLPRDFNKTSKAEMVGKKELALKAKIKKFVDSTLPDGCEIPKPGSGDCWYCAMFDAEPEVGMGRGEWRQKGPEKGKDASHLLSHIEEGYMHGSLIVNAFRASGYRDVGISMIVFSSRPDYKLVRQIVRKYLQRRLGLVSK